jgi:chromate reductase
MTGGPIRIVVVKGSVRPGNYTSMAAALVLDELRKNEKVSVEVIDPREMNLPLPGLDSSPDSARLKEIVTQATGIVFATPEYHGTFSSVTKLVIENLGFPSVLSGKPVALLGVAAGSIGAIKSLEHLRSVISHVGGLVLPVPISVANVQRVFDKDGRCLDPQVEKLVRSVPLNLLSYIERHICPSVTLERILREGLAKLPEDVVVA